MRKKCLHAVDDLDRVGEGRVAEAQVGEVLGVMIPWHTVEVALVGMAIGFVAG